MSNMLLWCCRRRSTSRWLLKLHIEEQRSGEASSRAAGPGIMEWRFAVGNAWRCMVDGQRRGDRWRTANSEA